MPVTTPDWPPPRWLLHTALLLENWFASVPFHDLPAEHAALWTSSCWGLPNRESQKVAFAYFVTILPGGP